MSRVRRLALMIGLAAAGCQPFAGDVEPATTGVVYSTPAGGPPLTLDIDRPPGGGRASPVVVFLPPLGDAGPQFKADLRCRELYKGLAAAGYAVVTPRYRILGAAPFPAQLEDARAAVCWVRANAGRYGLDAGRVGAAGASAGGALALLLGTAGPGDGFGPDDGPSGRVQAVVGLGVPADVSRPGWSGAIDAMYLRPYLGRSFEEAPDLYERASPAHYATPDDPPVLLFHSRHDLLVPVALARTFAARAGAAGVPVTLVEADTAEHAWTGDRLAWAVARTTEFFDRHLRGTGPGPTDLTPPLTCFPKPGPRGMSVSDP